MVKNIGICHTKLIFILFEILTSMTTILLYTYILLISSMKAEIFFIKLLVNFD